MVLVMSPDSHELFSVSWSLELRGTLCVNVLVGWTCDGCTSATSRATSDRRREDGGVIADDGVTLSN
jgi:hypothetical protein